MVHKVIVGL